MEQLMEFDADPPQPTPQSDSENIYMNLGNFEIGKKIGKGQFSEVYRAKNKINGSTVALKKVQVMFDFSFSLFVFYNLTVWI